MSSTPSLQESIGQLVTSYPVSNDNENIQTKKLTVPLNTIDLDSLTDGKLLNGNVMEFYVRMLTETLGTTISNIHFMNSSFYDNLIGNGIQGTYDVLKSWTEGVNLFQKLCIFFLIFINNHWSVIAVCHPGKAYCHTFHMDSQIFSAGEALTSSTHMTFKIVHKIFQFLKLEWNNTIKTKFIWPTPGCTYRLKVPSFHLKEDCGIFTIIFIKLFLQQIYVDTSFKIDNIIKQIVGVDGKFVLFEGLSPNFCQRNWFSLKEIPLMRSRIKLEMLKIFKLGNPMKLNIIQPLINILEIEIKERKERVDLLKKRKTCVRKLDFLETEPIEDPQIATSNTPGRVIINQFDEGIIEEKQITNDSKPSKLRKTKHGNQCKYIFNFFIFSYLLT
jgi:hypothetical protein